MKTPLLKFDAKLLGAIIVVLSVAVLYILISFSLHIARAEAAACIHPAGGECPVTAHIPTATYIGLVLLVAIGALGAHIALKSNIADKMKKANGRK